MSERTEKARSRLGRKRVVHKVSWYGADLERRIPVRHAFLAAGYQQDERGSGQFAVWYEIDPGDPIDGDGLDVQLHRFRAVATGEVFESDWGEYVGTVSVPLSGTVRREWYHVYASPIAAAEKQQSLGETGR